MSERRRDPIQLHRRVPKGPVASVSSPPHSSMKVQATFGRPEQYRERERDSTKKDEEIEKP